MLKSLKRVYYTSFKDKSVQYSKTLAAALVTMTLLSACNLNPVPVTPDERMATMMQDTSGTPSRNRLTVH